MTTYKEIFGKPIKVLTGDPAPTPITYTVTVANPGSGNVYYIDGVQTPTLELYEGNTYNFDYSAATGHPFRFATAADAAGSTQYTTGVSVDSNITTIVVASGAPNLFYYCTNHNGMGGRALTPEHPTEYEGQIWYNSTLGSFRSVLSVSAWSAGGNLSTARYGGASSGTETAALLSGGNTLPGGSDSPTGATEEYGGTSWTAGGSLSTARYSSGAFGVQTASLITGGDNRPPGSAYLTTTENYNGSSWTSGTAYPVAITNSAGFGTTTAGVIAGGGTPSSAPGVTTTTEYSGGSWTSGGALPLLRRWSGTSGTATAGLIFLGQTPPNVMANTDSYNGTAWTAEAAANTKRTGWYGGNMGSGTQTSAMMAGGWTPFTPNPTETERYDGSSWSTGPALASGIEYNSGGGSFSSGITTGGRAPGVVTTTQEFNTSIFSPIAATWASSGNMVNTLRGRASGGEQTASIAAGGETPRTADTEYYDGSSWSEQSNMNTARNQLGGAGTQTAFLVFGGEAPGPTAVTESWDGSSWSEVNDLGTARRNVGSFGTQTAAVAVGGFGPGVSDYSARVEEWNGSSWSSNPNALPNDLAQSDCTGIATAGLVFGGIIPPSGTKQTATFSFDGTSFSAGGALNTATTESHATAGSQTAALVAGGYAPAASTKTELYNGTSWSTTTSMATARGGAAGLGSNSVSTAALAAGGNNPGGDLNATEEFTGEIPALGYKTISDS